MPTVAGSSAPGTQETRAGRVEIAVTPFGGLRAGVRKAAEAEEQRRADAPLD